MYLRERKKNLQVNFKKTLFNEEKWEEQDKQATDDAKVVLSGCFWLLIALSVVIDLHYFRAVLIFHVVKLSHENKKAISPFYHKNIFDGKSM